MYLNHCTVDSDQLADEDLHCFMQQVMSMNYVIIIPRVVHRYMEIIHKP